jgi:hypothetical protein
MAESKSVRPAATTDCPYPYWIDGINNPKDSSRLVKRVKLSDLMNYDPRASYKHKQLWEFHLGWAHEDYNWTSLAAVRRIQAEMLARDPAGKAMSLHHIAAGDRDLVEWQYLFEDEKGKGRHGTRFSVNWELLELAAKGQFPVCVHPVGDAICVTLQGDSGVTLQGDANASCVHPVGDKDPTTQTRLPDGATSSSNDSAAPASPPHAAGLVPASGGAPQGRASDTVPAADTLAGGFDELWEAYRFKHDRAKAKAAYGKLSPDANLHAKLIAEAARWHAHYEGNNTEPRWRVRLHNWIGGEKYLEDVPQVYSDAKSAAISKTRGSAKPAKASTGRAAKPGCAFAAGETTITITKADLSKMQTSSLLILTAEDADGIEYIHTIPLEHHNEEVQAAGQREKDKLADAAGLYFGFEDAGQLVGRQVVALVDSGELTWHPPRGGQPQPEPEPVAPAVPPTPQPPTDYGTKEWEQRRTARLNAVAEWDAAHPEMFKDKDVRELTEAEEAERADYDAWYEASLEEDAA